MIMMKDVASADIELIVQKKPPKQSYHSKKKKKVKMDVMKYWDAKCIERVHNSDELQSSKFNESIFNSYDNRTKVDEYQNNLPHDKSNTKGNSKSSNTPLIFNKYPKPFRIRTASMGLRKGHEQRTSANSTADEFKPGSRILRKSNDNTSKIKRLKVPLKDFLLAGNEYSENRHSLKKFK
jgi:hypothetical protein